MSIRLMLVDDHKVLRIGLASLFRTVPGIQVVGEAGSASDAIDVARDTHPDVILMDVRLPDSDGVDACRTIISERPETRVVMLTSYADEDAVIASIMAGAAGYLLKQTDPERLIEAVQKVAGGASLLDPEITKAALEFMRSGAGAHGDDALGALSDQERRILPLIAEGKTNREIGAALSLSPHTVKTYVSSIFQKLHLTRRSQAAAYATRAATGGLRTH